MSELATGQIIGIIFCLCTGFALGLLYAKSDIKKTAARILDEIEKRIITEQEQDGEQK